MIQIDLQPDIERRLAVQAEARGQAFSDYLKELLLRQAEQPAFERASIAEAIQSIRQLRKGNTLGGLNIKDLIHEGHKY